MVEHELQRIYDSEINVRIGWLWDGGIDVRVGDEVNGFLAVENVPSTTEVLPWLQEAIAHFYPDSTYAKSLGPEIRERAARRIFRPPINGAQVRCPDCGAPHAAPPGMEELIAFTCMHCGKGVKLLSPRVS
jgi:DNA-directed RNA polymerase subunit RPC12/RpoP